MDLPSNVNIVRIRSVPKVVTDKVDVHTLTCDEGFLVSYEGETGKVSCTPIVTPELSSKVDTASNMRQNFTSNVNEFKSRKGRNVENFSQNTNGKCKARY